MLSVDGNGVADDNCGAYDAICSFAAQFVCVRRLVIYFVVLLLVT